MASPVHGNGEGRGRPLRVALLSDGIAGHFRQSEGVMAALERHRATELHRIELAKRAGPVRWLLGIAARLAPAAMPLRWYLGKDDLQPVDVVVSAGGRTLAANVVLTRQSKGVHNIFSGSPRQFPANAFTLVLLSYPAPDEKGIYVLKPTALDPDRLPPARRRKATGAAAPYRIAVLIGGPIPSCPFDDKDWRRILDLLHALARTPGVSLLPVTSRRTPAAWSDSLLAECQGLDGIERIIDFRTAGPGSVAAAFETDAIVATGDSMSMVSEAAAAQRAVAVLMPPVTQPSRDDATMRDLERRRRIARVTVTQAEGDTVLAALDATEPMAENHLDILADILDRALDKPRFP